MPELIGGFVAWSPAERFTRFMHEVEKRIPHPRPFDSMKMPEDYFLEGLDALIAERDELKRKLEGEGTNQERGQVPRDIGSVGRQGS